ncbi:MAG: YtxH domain-containing protein [Acidobacteria bacterium]|nr:YtxH domain-containing protein [Acidobacteriota bacterium]
MEKKEYLLLIGLGGLVGAALALLVTPYNGRRTRRGLKRVTGKMTRGVGELARDVNHQMYSLMDDLVETGQEITRKAVARFR